VLWEEGRRFVGESLPSLSESGGGASVLRGSVWWREDSIPERLGVSAMEERVGEGQ